MQEAFGIVLVVVVAVAALGALVAWLSGDSAYDQIWRGGLSLRDEGDAVIREPPAALASAERDEELRQMMEARNARRNPGPSVPHSASLHARALQK